jgi:hypothetical protein
MNASRLSEGWLLFQQEIDEPEFLLASSGAYCFEHISVQFQHGHHDSAARWSQELKQAPVRTDFD